jgi:hypothetical protein
LVVGALGVSLLVATIIASIIYMLAAMIIMNIIMKVATAIFGEKWGAVIAVIAMFVIGSMTVGGASGNAGAAASTGLTANQVINASTALLNAYGNYAAARIQDIYKDIGNLQAEYEKKFEELNEMMEKMLGTNTDLLDIQSMMDSTYIMNFERMETFLGRTLLTGNDVAEITLDQVTYLTELGLQLPTIG